MIDPADTLQVAVFAALEGSAVLQAVFLQATDGGPPRIYDDLSEGPPVPRTPPGPKFPYLTIGDDQMVDDGTGCGEATEAFVNVHVFSRAVGRRECKKLAGAVRETLAPQVGAGPPLVIEGQVCTEWEFRDTRFLTEPDGRTTHGVVGFRYLLDPA